MSDIEERLQRLELRLEKVEEVLHRIDPGACLVERLQRFDPERAIVEARRPEDAETFEEALVAQHTHQESVGRVPPGSLAPGDRILLDDSSSVWCVKRVHSHLRNFSVTVEAEAPWGETRHIHVDVAGAVHRIFS